MLEVSEEFVKQAHKAACQDWKEKIEAQFPTLFPGLISKIEKLQEYKDLKSYLMNDRIDLVTIKDNGKYIKIKLPNANRFWTFKAWKLAEAISENFDYYPQHGYETDNTHITLKK